MIEKAHSVTAEIASRLLPVDDVPVALDIGCGKGRFLCARAAAYPDTWFIGIDCMMSRLRRLARRAGRENLRNIRLWHIRAHETLLFLLPSFSISVCTVFFPDPWPKRRHHRRRLITPLFLEALANAMIPGGLVFLATDDAGYHRWITRVFGTHAAFQPYPALVVSAEQQTDFERLFIEKKCPIYRCAYRFRHDLLIKSGG